MDQILKDRRCFNCHVIKPLDQYNEGERRCEQCIEEIYSVFPFETKVCCSCKKEQPKREFNQSGKSNKKLYPMCRTCSKAGKKASRIKKPAQKSTAQRYKDRYGEQHIERQKQYERRRSLKKFGLSGKEYDDMFEFQSGLCAVCKKPETANARSKFRQVKLLAVDHDHDSGNVRGLLCGNCNTALGLMKDSVDNLQNAINYLTTHQATGTI